MIKILILLSLTLVLSARGYHTPDNRSQAKNIIKMLHLDYKTTWLNGCDYVYDVTSCMDKTIVERSTCSVTEVNQTMMWIQVVPDTFYGRKMVCMRETPCVNVFNGKSFGSPMCCRRINKKYRAMEADLFNLIPVVSVLATLRQGKIFGNVEHPERTIGEVKMDQNYLEPPDEVKGDIARVYLYMDERYGLQLSTQEKEMFFAWHRLDAVDERECALAKSIMKIQGTTNRFLQDGCQKK